MHYKRFHAGIKFMVVLCAAFSSSLVQAGGWNRPKGEGLIGISFSFMRGESIFLRGNNAGIMLPQPVLDATLSCYAEYGVSAQITVIGHLPLKYVAVEKTDSLPAAWLVGPGNFEAGLRWNLVDRNFKLAWQVLLGSKSCFSDSDAGLRSGYEAWYALPSLQLARSFGEVYAVGEAGLLLMSNGYSGKFQTGLKIGWVFSEHWFAEGYLVWLQSLYNGHRDDAQFLETALYVNNQEYLSPVLKAGRKFGDKHSFYVAAGFAFSGNYVVHFPGLSAGFVSGF
jgi:hypothetical protein